MTVAALATGTLLLVMQQLIATHGVELKEVEIFRLTPWVRVIEETPVEPKELLQRPPPVERQPQNELLQSRDASGGALRITPTGPITIDPGPIRDGSIFSDGDIIPITKVLPIYPQRAAVKGLEGYVVVEFVVTHIGIVENVSVVESTHSIFERAAIRAASQFRYKPRVIDGTAVAVEGVRNKISFQLEK